MNRTWLSRTLAVQCWEIVVEIYVFMVDRGEIGSGDVHRCNFWWPGGKGGRMALRYFFSTRELFLFLATELKRGLVETVEVFAKR